ncbi:hypothetical protein EW146_g6490 [Bondarzewia mesenterica]|uniref:Glucose-methanol-choline oxidoreductase N-terminal domain-containing protein n=1 Tax=Bondarzewia mesenterica TaxID=1095465 RepID=A0A4S4LPB8_9AGAM|nr:hypothetical protein EW146_g6490 [Bondarzewia mesenterica]
MSFTSSVEAEYDIIIAGGAFLQSVRVFPYDSDARMRSLGGTAGCVIAGRLASASPDLRILVLEAGPPTKDVLTHIQPARYLSHLAPTSTTVQFHVGNKSEALAGRQLVVMSGQCLGGGSSVNFQMYTRGSASDYDAWDQIFQNPGWGFTDLISLFKKTETYQVRPGAPNHGYSGPLKVSYGGTYTNVGEQFLEVVGQVDKERTIGDGLDANDFNSVNVYNVSMPLCCRLVAAKLLTEDFACCIRQRWAKWIDEKTGKRSDVPHHFIYDQEGTNNLHVVTGICVKRVIFQLRTSLFPGDRATGVEFQWNTRIVPSADIDMHTVSAKRMVVVSAGAFGSPAILERSGIRAPFILNKFGIPRVADLEGVGESYQDHNVVFTPYIAASDADSLDAIIRNETDEVSLTSGQWFKDGNGLMASNGIDAGMKMRPSADELREWGPEFKRRWDIEFADKPVILIGLGSMLLGNAALMEPRKYYSVAYFNLYPAARGHVHVTSAEDVAACLDFKDGYLEECVFFDAFRLSTTHFRTLVVALVSDSIADVKPLVWGYKFTCEIARRMPAFRGKCAPLHSKFPKGSNAALVEDGMPFPLDTPKVVYSSEDDEAIEKYIRGINELKQSLATCWHSLGTCAMKPRGEGGVVDPKLSVYGTKGLKVADMSICPGNVGGNTYSTALVIGENAVIIVSEDLRTKSEMFRFLFLI